MTSAPSWALSANGVFSSLGGGLGPAALALWGGAAAAAPLGVKDFSLEDTVGTLGLARGTSRLSELSLCALGSWRSGEPVGSRVCHGESVARALPLTDTLSSRVQRCLLQTSEESK